MTSGPETTCRDDRRRAAVREGQLNGLDYVEVSDDQRRLIVFFLGKAPEGVQPENVVVRGGTRIPGENIRAEEVDVCRQEEADLDDCMEIVVDRPGDFSTYTLCLVSLDQDGEPTDEPYPGFDPRYMCLEFSFKAACASNLDCKQPIVCPQPERVEPEIDYLAKDYASFRQLILDRLAVIMPDWRERHVPDLGIALVEVLAYVGDYLSYFQDAVATEAYLDTARQRISVRRHARLVDYAMHEGCNARAWVSVRIEGGDAAFRPEDIYFVTRIDDLAASRGRVLSEADLHGMSGVYEVFEPLVESPTESIRFYEAHNEIRFYTWGERECCLPRGATSATLLDSWVGAGANEAETAESSRVLQLRPGDVLIFEEVVGPQTGEAADADPDRRQAVRLTRVEPDTDGLYGQPVLEIEWAAEDALRFPLCISAIGPAPRCEMLEDISVSRGNVVLVDHGRRIVDQELGTVPEVTSLAECKAEGMPAETIVTSGDLRPRLEHGPLTFSQPLQADAPASQTLVQDPRKALPQIVLTSAPPPRDCAEPHWRPERDLLGSHGSDCHFVVEMDDDGHAHLRFGDGEFGFRPEAGTEFRADYRVGIGPAGNVGAETISHAVLRRGELSGITLQPRNPLRAEGGTAPEAVAAVKLFAPHEFRRVLERAVIADDYAQLAERHAGVQRAAAALRWMGSWYEVVAAIDPREALDAPEPLLDEIEGHLHPYRRMGHDLQVAPARYVPLDIELLVCVELDHLRGHVRRELLDLFSNRTLPGGRRGFFHPDNLSFGEAVYLSRLVAAAQQVPGVESVTVTRLERLYEGPNGELEAGLLALGPLEIARLDNDPSLPENGVLKLDLRGGR